VLVQNAYIDCNDDNFCLKAGRDADGLRVNRPCEYVLIQQCVAGAGGGLLTCGSETSGSIRHIIARHLRAKGTKNGIQLKSAINRGGTVEDILVEDIQLDSVRVPITITMNWNPAYSYSELPAGYTQASLPAHWKVMLTKVDPARGLPHFRNVRITNLQASGAQTAISASGLAASQLDNFRLNKVHISAKKAGTINFAHNWQLTNVEVSTSDSTSVAVKNSTNVRL
jgi:polygalacturonase